jgi:4'-phosphopantetheinyl transferase EntD
MRRCLLVLREAMSIPDFSRHDRVAGPASLSSGPPLRSSVPASMLGPGIAVAVATPMLVDDQLFADERQYISRAVEKRRAEFGTARVCARHALAELGVATCSLVPNTDRSPHWPFGIVGSISHTTGCCAVAVTRASQVIGLGIDVEFDTPLQPELISIICTTTERRWLDRCDRPAGAWLSKLLFCAKEAFYKCQYGTTRTPIDFRDVELHVDMATETFSVAGIAHQGPQWDLVRQASGKFRRDSGFVVTTAVLNTGP